MYFVLMVEWMVTVKLSALDYFASRTNTRDLVFDFLILYLFFIVFKYVDCEWDFDVDSCDGNDVVLWFFIYGFETLDVDSAMEYDLFGIVFYLGVDFLMII